MRARKWDDIYNNLDALTPEDREEIALKVKIIGEILKARVLETDDGLSIRPIKGDPIKELKGFLKGSTFNTEKFMRQKKQDKCLEQ